MKLVCTDLDRTLLPNGEQPESAHARPILWHLLKTYSVTLAYVSGRDLQRVLDAIDEFQLPKPDYIVGDVGASLYIQEGEDWVHNTEWETTISKNWNGHDSLGIKAILKDIYWLQDQEEDRQSRYKRSYYYQKSANETALVDTIEARLIEKRIKASIVLSHDPEKGVGLLDVLPLSATKREAVLHIQSMCQLTTAEVMFAGDSGNDVLALCAQYPGVLVANADAPTTDTVKASLRESSEPASTYLAKGGLEVAGYDALNGNYSAGIVEGLMHFRPQWLEHLHDEAWVSSAMHSAVKMRNASGRHPA